MVRFLVGSEVEKDVGVLVTSNVKPGQQCTKETKKARQFLGQMAMTFHYRDKYTWVKLYKTYVRCHLEYCVQAWFPCQVCDIELLECAEEGNWNDVKVKRKDI